MSQDHTCQYLHALSLVLQVPLSLSSECWKDVYIMDAELQVECDCKLTEMINRVNPPDPSNVMKVFALVIDLNLERSGASGGHEGEPEHDMRATVSNNLLPNLGSCSASP